MSITVLPDPDRPEGGHAIIRLAAAPGGAEAPRFEISGLDGADEGEDDWPRGMRAPLATRRHADGLDLAIGPDIVMAIPEGTPVEIAVPELGLLGEMRWPALPLMRSSRRGASGGAMIVPALVLASGPVERVVSPSRQPARAEPADTAGSTTMAAKQPALAATTTPVLDPPPRRGFGGFALAALGGFLLGALLVWSTAGVWNAPKSPDVNGATAGMSGSAVFSALRVGPTSPKGQSAAGVDAAEAYRRAVAARDANRVGGGPESLFWLKQSVLAGLGGEQQFSLHAVALAIFADPLAPEAQRQAALALWQVAAAAGSRTAFCNLAQTHRLGLGVAKNESQAAEFQSLAGAGACAGLKPLTIPPRDDKR